MIAPIFLVCQCNYEKFCCNFLPDLGKLLDGVCTGLAAGMEIW